MYSFVCMVCIMINAFLKENRNYKSPRDRIFDSMLTCNFLEEGLRGKIKKMIMKIHAKVVFLSV